MKEIFYNWPLMNRVIIVGVLRGVGWGAGDIVCSQNILFCYKTDMLINGRVVGEGWVRPRVFSGTAISWAMENKFR